MASFDKIGLHGLEGDLLDERGMNPANDNSPLGAIYTLDEAAAYLRIHKNALARHARRTGNCSVFGRTILFNDSDLLAIWDDARCRSQNSNEGKSGISAAPSRLASEANPSTIALDFLTRGRRKSSASKRKAA